MQIFATGSQRRGFNGGAQEPDDIAVCLTVPTTLTRETTMEIKPNTAKVVDLSTRFETMPIDTDVGPVLWADVEITYILAGLTPTVDIRVPVPFEAGDSDAERKRQALRNARLLIDHACKAASVDTGTAVDPAEHMGETLDAVTPSMLEGIVQELGLASPTSKPRSPRQTK